MAQNLVVQLLLKTGTFSTDLKTAKGQIQNFQKGCDTAGRSLDAFGKSIGINVGSFMKFGSAIGAATLAAEGLKKIISSNQTLSDNFSASIYSAKSAIGELAYAMGTFDFSNFSNGLGDLLERSRRVAETLDQLGNTIMSYNIISADANARLSAARAVISNPKSTPKQVAEAKIKMEEALDELRSSASVLMDDYKNALIAEVNEKGGSLSGEGAMTIIDKWLTMDARQGREIAKKNAKESYDAYVSAVNELKSKYTNTYTMPSTWGATTMTKFTPDDSYYSELKKLNEQYKDAIAYNALLVKYDDEGLNKLGQQRIAMIGINAQLDQYEYRMNNIENKGNGSGTSTISTPEVQPEEGTRGFYEQQKLEVAKEYKLAKTFEDTQKVDAKIAEIQKKIDLITNGQKEENEELMFTKKHWNDIIQENEELLNIKPKGSEAYNDALDKIKEAKQVLLGWDLADALLVEPPTLNSLNTAKRLIEELIGDIAIGSEQFEFWQGRIKLIEEKLKEARGEVATAPKTDTWDSFNTAMSQTATIVSTLTNTFKDGAEVTAASILQMVATALPAIGQLISSISALTAVEAVEAGVGAVGKAVSSSKHWIEAIAAVAALGAVVAAAIGSAKSQGQKFAEGGIVGGTSFTGDRVSAQVNSGEMILNGAQQARLFRMANGSSEGRSQVEFHISGTDLVGVLNNQNRKNRIIR